MTVQEVIDAVLGLAFPRRFNPSMLPVRVHHVIHGLTEVQRRVEGFQVANIEFTPGSFELMVSGATIIPAPQSGRIEQVVIGAENCESIFADLMPRGQIQQFQTDWAHGNGCGTPDVVPVYPQERVVWARDDGDLMVYPWVPVPWTIGVRWRGIRRDWPTGADVWWATLAIEALRMFVMWKSAVDENCDMNQIAILKQDFVDESAKLKTEDFQIRHPAPGETYASDVMGHGMHSCGSPVTSGSAPPAPSEPPPTSDTMELSELTVTGGITLGGVRNTEWPEGGGGVGTAFLDYNFNPNAPPPASGQIRRNNSDGSLATALLVHKMGNDGIDNTKVLVKIPFGTLIYLQDWNDSTRWVRYISTNSPALVSDSYYDIPVSYHSDSGVILLTQRIAMHLTVLVP